MTVADGAVGIVLAAGAGTRFGRPKADVPLNGERLLDRAVRVLHAGGCAEVIAVVRAGTQVPDARAVLNPDPDRGMSSSLRLGLAAAAETAAKRAVVILVDMPGITAAAVATVAAGTAAVTIAGYGGRRGHPIAFDRAVWAQVAIGAAGDAGARGFIDAHPELVTMADCPGERPVDLDTPAQLDAWIAGS